MKSLELNKKTMLVMVMDMAMTLCMEEGIRCDKTRGVFTVEEGMQ